MGGEIVVADPFQRYRGLEIAADSPRPRERAEVRYHLVGDLDLHQTSSAGEFARLAHAAIDDILERARLPIVTGGTGLYLRAALADLNFPDPVPPEVRSRVEAMVEDDLGRAVNRLRELDAAVADRIDVANPRRVVRALELAEAGHVAREAPGLWAERTRLPTLMVGLDRPREVLDALIAWRVRRELDDGLADEIAAAMDRPAGVSREAAQIIGVREIQAVRSGDLRPEQLESALAARTRRLARRQRTWLRKTPGISWLEAGDRAVEALLPEFAYVVEGRNL